MFAKVNSSAEDEGKADSDGEEDRVPPANPLEE